MSERTPGYGAPKEMGGWADDVVEADHAVDTHNLHTGSREGFKGEQPRRVISPMAKKVISLMLVGAIAVPVVRSISETYNSSQESTAFASSQIDKKIEANEKTDAEARLRAEGVTDADIEQVLNDPELMKIYEEFRTEDPAVFDQAFRDAGIEIDQD